MRCRWIGELGLILRSGAPPTNSVLPSRYEISAPNTQDKDSAWESAERQVREAGNSTVVSVKSERSKNKKRKVDDAADGEDGEPRKEKRKKDKGDKRDGGERKRKGKGEKEGRRKSVKA